ncbi:MAG: sugar transferase [Parachlamydiaceae bacterium]|nr:sugar transferase [Parachlamydiaceae bacterium]
MEHKETLTLTVRVKHRPIKRIFDLFFTCAAMVFCLPLLLVIFVMIRFSSPGKAIYSHERIGRGGKPFRCYKFRTMYVDADERLQELLASDSRLNDEWIRTRKLKNDPRVTPIGIFLRKASLDELPQFWNVLRGDLSVVGPRPVVYDEVVHYLGEKAPKILSMRPGLTCIWQVSGRNDTSYVKRIQLDEHYIDNHSIILDCWLILKTIPSMIFSKGAY